MKEDKEYFLDNIGNCNFEICIDTSEECIKEVESLKCNKIQFLNSKIEERLNRCNNTFLEEFYVDANKIIDIIDSDNYSNKEYMKMLNKISKATSISQRTFLIILKELSSIKKEV